MRPGVITDVDGQAPRPLTLADVQFHRRRPAFRKSGMVALRYEVRKWARPKRGSNQEELSRVGLS